jgi:hypothetical protein
MLTRRRALWLVAGTAAAVIGVSAVDEASARKGGRKSGSNKNTNRNTNSQTTTIDIDIEQEQESED